MGFTELLQMVALALLAVAAGVSVVVQQAFNADLRVSLGSASWAAFISYVVGSLTLAVVLLAMREPLVSAAAVTKSSAWSWTGGVFGTIYIVVSILLLPHLGAATVVALLVTGQMLGSLVSDHYGLFGLTPHPFDLFRLTGAALLLAGVVLIRH
jgi:bacterial/archaeal transporter family-2 protein